MDAGRWLNQIFAGLMAPTLEEVCQLKIRHQRGPGQIGLNVKILSPRIEVNNSALVEGHDPFGGVFAFGQPAELSRRFMAQLFDWGRPWSAPCHGGRYWGRTGSILGGVPTVCGGGP